MVQNIFSSFSSLPPWKTILFSSFSSLLLLSKKGHFAAFPDFPAFLTSLETLWYMPALRIEIYNKIYSFLPYQTKAVLFL